jgi:hypothetical protein
MLALFTAVQNPIEQGNGNGFWMPQDKGDEYDHDHEY